MEGLLPWASVVILAVPFPIALAMAGGPLGGHGDGRTLVDVTNPTMTPLDPGGVGRSAGERIAEAAPGWRVAKAFNTVPAALIAQIPGVRRPISLPVASDHASAVGDVFALAGALGFAPIDAGGIATSRHLESLAVLLRQISVRHPGAGRVTIHVDFQKPPSPIDGDGSSSQPSPRGVARSSTPDLRAPVK
ncbi:NADPH-dependent F420 reductase [Micromonospora sp. NPDC049900]|uniref:NADPH-dependent F420 reductase n=1 Tax=Micromonospora sp. NPDC049900 TaxID=3364275 RepID=UPI0037939C20